VLQQFDILIHDLEKRINDDCVFADNSQLFKVVKVGVHCRALWKLFYRVTSLVQFSVEKQKVIGRREEQS